MTLSQHRSLVFRLMALAGMMALLLSLFAGFAGKADASALPASGLPSGLVARYTFDNNDAADASGNGNNGTVVGSPSFAPGPAGFGNALVVDLGKYVILPDTNTLGLYDHDFTVTAWVNASAFSGLGGYGSDWAVLGNQSGPDGLHLVLRGGYPYMGFLGNDIGSGSRLSLNQWYHIAWRYTKSTGEQALFLNGNLISSGGGHRSFKGTGSTYIGRCCETWDSPRYAKGMIDDVQIYNRPLAQTEVASLVAPPVPAPPQDTTPPVITPTVTGTAGNNGWYTSNVSVNWTITDDESAVTATSNCEAQTVTTDSVGITFTCSATSAGGTASESVTVKRDATAPSIVAGTSPVDNGAGWYNNTTGAPTVSFTCNDDGGSGVASCTPSVTLNEGAAQSVSGSATDVAGNTTSTTVSGVNVDLTSPSALITGVADGATYTLGAVPTAGETCSDALSGVASSSGSTTGGTANGVGSFTYTVVCADIAGNTTTVSATYAVEYSFSGFLQPIPLPVSTFKAGSTIPVKFKLTDAGGMSVGTAEAQVSVNGGAPLGTARYDETDQQYVFNLKTKGLPVGALTITVTLDDGTDRSVTVTLR